MVRRLRYNGNTKNPLYWWFSGNYSMLNMKSKPTWYAVHLDCNSHSAKSWSCGNRLSLCSYSHPETPPIIILDRSSETPCITIHTRNDYSLINIHQWCFSEELVWLLCFPNCAWQRLLYICIYNICIHIVYTYTMLDSPWGRRMISIKRLFISFAFSNVLSVNWEARKLEKAYVMFMLILKQVGATTYYLVHAWKLSGVC